MAEKDWPTCIQTKKQLFSQKIVQTAYIISDVTFAIYLHLYGQTGKYIMLYLFLLGNDTDQSNK